MPQDVEELESFDREDQSEPIPPSDVVAYNELRSCADLFRLHSSGKLEVKPDFQREVVWKNDEQTRFIDSLVKNLPIPSMCFSLDYKTQRWKVIDGLQRMTSIIKFLSATEWKLSDLEDIRTELKSPSNLELRNGSDTSKQLFSMVEDVSIPVTVIRCDYTKESHMQYLFTIFHRLNSGGVRLTNQEIRNCIFTGRFNDFLKNFDATNSEWIAVKRRIWGAMDRYRSVEILLRVLAFSEELPSYDGNLAKFLNKFMQAHINALPQEINHWQDNLSTTCAKAKNALAGENSRKLSLALVEALLVALYYTVSSSIDFDDDELKNCYSILKTRPAFASSARYAISSADNVKNRLAQATASFIK